MRRVTTSVKPIVISPVPAVAPASAPRSVSVKRLSRLRFNWFFVGSVFGVGMSFFMNFLLGSVLLPAYGSFTGGLWCHDPALTSLMAADAMAILTGPKCLKIPMPRRS